MHECAVHAMKGYWSCMKTVDHSYEQALIMHDNVHIHVIMNIIVTPTYRKQKKFGLMRGFACFCRYSKGGHHFYTIGPLKVEAAIFSKTLFVQNIRQTTSKYFHPDRFPDAVHHIDTRTPASWGTGPDHHCGGAFIEEVRHGDAVFIIIFFIVIVIFILHIIRLMIRLEMRLLMMLACQSRSALALALALI